MSLPNTGDFNWGVNLNAYITNVVLAEANTAAASIASHQAASDPHGDRAYALSLVQPLTTGVNGPNGFLQLNNIGKIPTGVLPPGGGRTSAFDVVKDYGALTNGAATASAIQSALNDCGTAGGGEVWVGDGLFGIDTTLYVPSNVWLHLSPGATMQRVLGSGGVAPTYMVANFNGAVSSSGAGNIIIQGGTWNFASQSAAGTAMAFVGGSGVTVRDSSITALAGSPAILFAGCTDFEVLDANFSAAAPGSSRATYTGPPAIRVETAASSVISGLNSGMYTNSACNIGLVRGCSINGLTASDGTGLYTVFNGLAGTTGAVSSSFHTNITVDANIVVALPSNAVYAANWQTAIVTNNQFNINNGQVIVTTWSPSVPAGANQVVGNNSQGASSGAGVGTTTGVYKTSNTSRANSTTLTLDPTLQATVVANAVYEVRCVAGYSSSSTSEGISWDFQTPGSGVFTYSAVSDAPGGIGSAFFDTDGTPDSAATLGSPYVAALQFTGLLVTGNTGAGTFGLKWAQTNSSGTALIVYQGSYLALTRLA